MKKILAVVISALLGLSVLIGCGSNTPSGKVEELEGLKGRVVYSIGQGNVPDLVFRWLLKSAGVEYDFSDKAQDGKVSLAYVAEGAEFIGGLAAGKMNYGVISEPAATQSLGKAEGAARMLDIQTLYKNAAGSEKGYPQAALVVKKTFLAEHPGYVAQFAAAFESGAKWAENEPALALAAIKKAGSTTVPALTAEIAKGCNLGFTRAADVKTDLLNFYAALNEVKREGESGVAEMPENEFFAGQISGESETGVSAKVYVPDGAPAIGMAKLIADGYEGAEFHVVPPARIMENFVRNADIAVMPTNAAAIRYAADKSIIMLGVTNFGSLYLIGRE